MVNYHLINTDKEDGIDNPFKVLLTSGETVSQLFDKIRDQLKPVFMSYKLTPEVYNTLDFDVEHGTFSFVMTEVQYDNSKQAVKKHFTYEDGKIYLKSKTMLFKSLKLGGVPDSFTKLAGTRDMISDKLSALIAEAENVETTTDAFYNVDGVFYIDMPDAVNARFAQFFELAD